MMGQFLTSRKKKLPMRAERGFTILLAALVASIVLALGSSIFSIAQKQISLSSIGRDSQFAFYAADTGAECALFWDLRQVSTFATSSDPAFDPVPITCDGQTVTPDVLQTTANSAVSEFSLDLFTSSAPQSGNCIVVQVRKNPTNPYTVIHADGYNVNCASEETSARSLQRSVELRY